MKSFIKRFCILTVLFSLCAFNCFAQNYEDVFNYGIRLWEGDARKEAVTEFKRFIYVTEQSGKSTEKNINRLGECYRYLSFYYEESGDIPKAIEYQKNLLNLNAADSDILREILLLKKLAEQENISLENNLDLWAYRYLEGYSKEVCVSAWKTVLFTLVLSEDWDTFEVEYNQFIQDFPEELTESEKNTINETLLKIRKFKPKNPMLAAHLSFIPGLGQLYAGDVKDSLNAFLLNGSLITLSVYSLCTGGYSEFSLLEMNPTFRFYKGNIYNAQRDVYTYNAKKVKKLKAPLEKILEP